MVPKRHSRVPNEVKERGLYSFVLSNGRQNRSFLPVAKIQAATLACNMWFINTVNLLDIAFILVYHSDLIPVSAIYNILITCVRGLNFISATFTGDKLTLRN